MPATRKMEVYFSEEKVGKKTLDNLGVYIYKRFRNYIPPA